MKTKQVKALTAEIMETMGRRLDASGEQVAGALSEALAEHLGRAGGVMLVWWDPERGLQINPVPYGVDNGRHG